MMASGVTDLNSRTKTGTIHAVSKVQPEGRNSLRGTRLVVDFHAF